MSNPKDCAKSRLETQQKIVDVLLNTAKNPTLNRCKEAYNLSSAVRRRAREDWENMQAPYEHIRFACIYALPDEIENLELINRVYQTHVIQSRIFEEKFPAHQLTDEEQAKLDEINHKLEVIKCSPDSYSDNMLAVKREIDRLYLMKHCITGTYDPHYFDKE